MIQPLQANPRWLWASDLRRTYLIFTGRRRWVSRVPFPPPHTHTSPLLALPAKEILRSVTNGRGALGCRQCGGGPPPFHLRLPPPHPPSSPQLYHLHPPNLLPPPRSGSARSRVLPDNHNCVLKPLIKFRSLEWYCFAMNPYEKCFTLGDYGSGVGGGGGRDDNFLLFFFFETSKASMDAKWIPAITLLLFLRPLLLHPSVTLPLYVINTHRDINIPPFFLNSSFSLTPTGTQVPQPSRLRKVSETFLKLVSEPSQCERPFGVSQ